MPRIGAKTRSAQNTIAVLVDGFEDFEALGPQTRDAQKFGDPERTFKRWRARRDSTKVALKFSGIAA